ncbi:MAG: RNA-binding S4 domain-containing protein [Clostridia bacterium]|nr:RNA-binding S4 domain-containing protein [Clostridia bacterium]
MNFKEIFIKEEYIRLDSALKLASLVSTGGHAKIVIQNGEVKVNGEICLQRGKKLKIGDTAQFNNKGLIIKYAS